MALFDKLKETAQKGADLAREGVKAGQEKIETVKIERRISDLKEELGGVVYAQRSASPPADADAEIQRLVDEITAAEAELAKAHADGEGTGDAAGS
jgi:hypothetical protein